MQKPENKFCSRPSVVNHQGYVKILEKYKKKLEKPKCLNNINLINLFIYKFYCSVMSTRAQMGSDKNRCARFRAVTVSAGWEKVIQSRVKTENGAATQFLLVMVNF